MATYYSTLYGTSTNQATSGGAISTSTTVTYKGPTGTRAGEVVAVRGTVTIASAVVATELHKLFPLPAGARITRFAHHWDDLGGTMTGVIECDTTDMKIGIAMGTAQAASATTGLSDAENATAWAVNATATKDIQLNFSAATTPIGGSVYTFDAAYAMAA